jgi:regulator of RNase E activity RraA
VVFGGGIAVRRSGGELMSTSARSRGLAGTIIDGAVRDMLELQANRVSRMVQKLECSVKAGPATENDNPREEVP